jgi:hypothetical protein
MATRAERHLRGLLRALAGAPRIGTLGLFLLARRSCIALRFVRFVRFMLVARACLFGFRILLHLNLLMMTTRALQQQLDRPRSTTRTGWTQTPGTGVAENFLSTL